MNSAFFKSLKAKKKRPVDPDAPPRPTLLGQVKDLRLTKEAQVKTDLELTFLSRRLIELEARNRYLETKLNNIENYLRNIK